MLYSDNEDEKVITRSVLLYTLDQILRLLHPIMPFVTEEIFGQISEGIELAVASLNQDGDRLAWRYVTSAREFELIESRL